MADNVEGDNRRIGSTLVWVVVTVVVVPVLYVLSIGPAVWLVHHDLASASVLWLYKPIDWLARTFPLVSDALKEYLWLWR